jgi:hypothetical protein
VLRGLEVERVKEMRARRRGRRGRHEGGRGVGVRGEVEVESHGQQRAPSDLVSLFTQLSQPNFLPRVESTFLRLLSGLW